MRTPVHAGPAGRLVESASPEVQVEGAGPVARPATTLTEPPPVMAAPETRRPAPRYRWRRLALVGGVAMLVALWLRPAPLDVQATAAVRGPLETLVHAEGTTRVRDRFEVAAPIAGRVERITHREGDRVAEGDVLARITPMPLDPQAASQAAARVAAAAAVREEAGARLAQARDALGQTERTTARVREVASAGGMSRDAVERAELGLTAARHEFEAAGSRARAADAELAAARAALLDVDPAASTGRAVSTIRAPIDGVVLRLHEPSERIVAAGTPLLSVGDAAGMEAVVEVLSSDAVHIEPGATVRLVGWGGDTPIAAHVRLVEPAGFTKLSSLGVEEQRVRAVLDLVDAPRGLGDGYRVEARIVTWEAADVLKVPNSALFRSGTSWAVFVVEGGRARKREVRLGHRGASEAEVAEGLSTGERVVLFPSDRLVDGGRVRVAGG